MYVNEDKLSNIITIISRKSRKIAVLPDLSQYLLKCESRSIFTAMLLYRSFTRVIFISNVACTEASSSMT